jgi:hypothetical protein
METQQEPRFRPRVLPMPKVGDVIVWFFNRETTFTVTRIKEDEQGIFYAKNASGHETAFDIQETSVNWQDPAVEAQRLQEAAWRADTSPLPEDLLSAIEETKYSFKRGHERSAEVLHELMFADGGVFNLGEPDLIKISDAARSCMKHVYNLLRWQAQQEGAKHE